jgi:hypothetical protein
VTCSKFRCLGKGQTSNTDGSCVQIDKQGFIPYFVVLPYDIGPDGGNPPQLR